MHSGKNGRWNDAVSDCRPQTTRRHHARSRLWRSPRSVNYNETPTSNKNSCDVQKIAHQNPVSHHSTNKSGKSENDSQPFASTAKVVFANIGKLKRFGICCTNESDA